MSWRLPRAPRTGVPTRWTCKQASASARLFCPGTPPPPLRYTRADRRRTGPPREPPTRPSWTESDVRRRVLERERGKTLVSRLFQGEGERRVFVCVVCFLSLLSLSLTLVLIDSISSPVICPCRSFSPPAPGPEAHAPTLVSESVVEGEGEVEGKKKEKERRDTRSGRAAGPLRPPNKPPERDRQTVRQTVSAMRWSQKKNPEEEEEEREQSVRPAPELLGGWNTQPQQLQGRKRKGKLIICCRVTCHLITRQYRYHSVSWQCNW